MQTYVTNKFRIMCNENAAHTFNMLEPHFHDEYELYYLMSGTRLFFIENRVYPMVTGCLTFVDGEHMHRAFSKSDMPHTRFIVCIRKNVLKQENSKLTEPFIKGGCIALSSKEQIQIELIIRQIIEECSHSRTMQHEYIALLVHQLLIYTFRRYHTPAHSIEYGGADIIKLLRYIDENYTRRITLGELCDYLNISISHLTRLFKTSTGYTIIEYINNMRIRKASGLLLHTDIPVSEIALETGFSSFSYFGKLFRACYGISPLRYRSRNRL